MRPTLTGIEQVLADAGGVDAPRERVGQLRRLLGQELGHGAAGLGLSRPGYEPPVVVVAAAHPAGGLVGVVPVAPDLRADPDAVDERSWLLSAAGTGALSDAVGGAVGPGAGTFEHRLALHVTGAGPPDPELFALAFEEQIASVDRLRAALGGADPPRRPPPRDRPAPPGRAAGGRRRLQAADRRRPPAAGRAGD